MFPSIHSNCVQTTYHRNQLFIERSNSPKGIIISFIGSDMTDSALKLEINDEIVTLETEKARQLIGVVIFKPFNIL